MGSIGMPKELSEHLHPGKLLSNTSWLILWHLCQDLTRLSQSTVYKVKSWLMQSGIAADRISLTQSGGWLSLDVSVAEAESLLRTKYHVFTHRKLGNQIACGSYSVPAYLASYIDVITPTVHLTPMRPYTLHVDSPRPIQTTSHGNCSSQITLDCLRSLYGIPRNPEVSPQNSYGIPEMDGEVRCGCPDARVLVLIRFSVHELY